MNANSIGWYLLAGGMFLGAIACAIGAWWLTEKHREAEAAREFGRNVSRIVLPYTSATLPRHATASRPPWSTGEFARPVLDLPASALARGLHGRGESSLPGRGCDDPEAAAGATTGVTRRQIGDPAPAGEPHDFVSPSHCDPCYHHWAWQGSQPPIAAAIPHHHLGEAVPSRRPGDVDTLWDVPDVITRAGGLPPVVQATLGSETVPAWLHNRFDGIEGMLRQRFALISAGVPS